MEHIYQNIQGWCDYYDFYDYIIDKMPNNFVFAEVGVWKGQSLSYFVVESINKHENGTIYAIDHWQGSIEHLNAGSPSYTPILKDNPNGLFDLFKHNISPIEQYITVLRNTSEEAATIIPDRSLDAVFIDASHEYEDIFKDLSLWMPKVKTGGVFAGHDYLWFREVKQAVDEFASINNLKVHQVSKACFMMQF